MFYILTVFSLIAAAQAQFSGGFISDAAPPPQTVRPPAPAQPAPQRPAVQQPAPVIQQPVPPPVVQQPIIVQQTPPRPPQTVPVLQARIGDQYKCGRGGRATDRRSVADAIVVQELGMSIAEQGTYLQESSNFQGTRVNLTILPRETLTMRYAGAATRDIPLSLCKVSDGLIRVFGTTTGFFGQSTSFNITLRVPNRNRPNVVRVEGLGEYDNDYTVVNR